MVSTRSGPKSTGKSELPGKVVRKRTFKLVRITKFISTSAERGFDGHQISVSFPLPETLCKQANVVWPEMEMGGTNIGGNLARVFDFHELKTFRMFLARLASRNLFT